MYIYICACSGRYNSAYIYIYIYIYTCAHVCAHGGIPQCEAQGNPLHPHCLTPPSGQLPCMREALMKCSGEGYCVAYRMFIPPLTHFLVTKMCSCFVVFLEAWSVTGQLPIFTQICFFKGWLLLAQTSYIQTLDVELGGDSSTPMVIPT
jgi:hypothetical protein